MGRTEDATTLWAVIEGMQVSLEAEGLDDAVVDAAITRGIEAILRKRPGNHTRSSLLSPLGILARA